MDRRTIGRVASWMLLVLASTALAGCAALDLLEGQFPGEEEEPAPVVEASPYPGSRPVAAERPAAGATAVTTQKVDAPAPVVSPSAAIQSPPKSASPSPAVQPAPATPAAAAAAAPSSSETKPDVKQPPAEAKTASSGSETVDDTKKPQPTPEERLAVILRHRDELIASLEAEVKLRSGKQDVDGELPRMQQQLRLLYLLAERPDDAVGEIESLPAAEQEAFKQLMFGLSTWLAAQEDRRPTLRNARVLRSLNDAAGQLAAAAKLDVRNLRFCEGVEGFGWYKEFPTAQFRAKQQVILYAEVDNFASEKKGPETYETELAVSYQIFDDRGTLVDERELPLDKEVCKNQRRDYFLAYRIYLPDGIAAGRYRLELTVEDLKAKEHYQGRKLGDGQIEFSIR